MSITRELWLHCIESAYRSDKYIADMMLRACGVTREQARGIVKAPRTEYDGIYECFKNERSPMDWR